MIAYEDYTIRDQSHHHVLKRYSLISYLLTGQFISPLVHNWVTISWNYQEYIDHYTLLTLLYLLFASQHVVSRNDTLHQFSRALKYLLTFLHCDSFCVTRTQSNNQITKAKEITFIGWYNRGQKVIKCKCDYRCVCAVSQSVNHKISMHAQATESVLW